MRWSALVSALVIWIGAIPGSINTHFTASRNINQQGCAYWVAPPPAGSDGNPGSEAAPWATLLHAVENIPDNFCIVHFHEGEYFGTSRINRRFTTPTVFKSVQAYQAIFVNDGAVLSVSGGRNIAFEGFIFTHSGPGAGVLLVQVDRNSENWAEWITFRNNIFHDSYNNDLLKIYNGARFVTVEGNVFYNQQGPDQHIDVNSVTDVTIQDNLFFNDFSGSGRSNLNDTKHYIVIKDSNANEDGLEGSERITVRRNIFLNWEGGEGETFIQVGNDGKPYYEAKNVKIENNLFIGNAPNQIGSAFGVSGARDVWFTNNTVVGDLPSMAYAMRIVTKDQNPQNQNIYFYNNIWSDASGTMGADASGSENEFSDGGPAQTQDLVLDNNLYWNGGMLIPDGDLVSPLVDDVRRIVADPLINPYQSSVILPKWNGRSFLSGKKTIREEFVRLVEQCAKIPSYSQAVGKADPAFAPGVDILNQPRTATPELGAYEYRPILLGINAQTTLALTWTEIREPGAVSLEIIISDGDSTQTISGISPASRYFNVTGLRPLKVYQVTLVVLDRNGAVLARSNSLTSMTDTAISFFPILFMHQLHTYVGRC